MRVFEACKQPSREALPVSSSSRAIDRLEATFDHDGLVANAGLIVAATLMSRLGLEKLIGERVGTGSPNPGRKLLTLVAAMLAGATHIDHVDILRAGATQRVLPFVVAAPSTVGTFLRSFTFGHVRQLDAVLGQALARAWRLGAGPGDAPLVMDLDSTITEVHGHAKAGAAYGYTRQLGYHPLLATRADTGEVLFCRLRKGSAASGRGVARFVDELVAVVKRAGATAAMTVRADAGFWSWTLIDRLDAHGVTWSITVTRQPSITRAIEAIPESAWVDIAYTRSGQAQVAETTYTASTRGQKRQVRLIVRRTRFTAESQQQLWADWRHHAFITNTDLDPVAADEFHRDHAVVELAIRDLKQGVGVEHMPSGRFGANGAWLAAAALAHNLNRWTLTLADQPPATNRTLRTRLIALAAVIVNRSGRPTLRLPTRWPWADTFTTALTAMRALPAPSG
jgi:hypothetical protein